MRDFVTLSQNLFTSNFWQFQNYLYIWEIEVQFMLAHGFIQIKNLTPKSLSEKQIQD